MFCTPSIDSNAARTELAQPPQVMFGTLSDTVVSAGIAAVDEVLALVVATPALPVLDVVFSAAG